MTINSFQPQVERVSAAYEKKTTNTRKGKYNSIRQIRRIQKKGGRQELKQ